MFRALGIFLLGALFLTAELSLAADQQGGAAVKQAEFARKLVDAFGWSEGLPEKPTDGDYLAILGGNRSLKFEAEDSFDRIYDTVIVRNYNLFGAFTGSGWLHGTTSPTAAHFKVLIPVAGKYTVKATAQGDGQLWSIAGKAFKVNSGPTLKETVIGTVFIPAGQLEFNTVIPPGGAIDNLLFAAPSLAPLEPVSGWNLASDLTGGQLAEIAAAILGTEALLPDDSGAPAKTIAAVAASPLPNGLFATESQILGKTVSPRWVRAGQVAVTLPVPLEIDAAAVYKIRVRFVGTVLTAGFGPGTRSVPGKDYFDWVDLGAFRLTKGIHKLQLQLPPSGGVDQVEVTRKLSAPADFIALAKLGKGADEKIRSSEVDAIIKLLQEKFRERK